MKNPILIIIFCSLCFSNTNAQLVVENKQPKSFSLSETVIYVDTNDFPLVKKAAELLKQDIEAVTGKKVLLKNKITLSSKNVIIIGSIERSSWIKQLKQLGKINISSISGKWEAYRVESIRHPFAGTDNALVIAGSDRRGTAYGVFEVSKRIGVSPWYWWADVPVKKKAEIFINANTYFSDSPKVRYRGIFINDEAPALAGWTKEKFGGFNHKFYEKVFELILRLKGNYLWPAMWGNAFYYDDTLNIKSADEFGVVIGTSHHEPLMRAHEEWKYFGKGRKWNYDSTEQGLKEYWKGGMQRAWNEKIVSVGMRGDGDAPMTRETATGLLERIVKDQRQIIEQVTGKPASETPQLWALYKEVQDYYDKGMRVPDDVTLLLCDDNWGNIRKLPKPGDPPRKGGYGIYYHFDYVGGPRNYKWINTNNIARVWEQMHLAYEYGVRQIWIVNVGDIKPMEFPISFWLDYAWDPEKIGADDLQNYTEQWAGDQFGDQHAKQIGIIIWKYSQYAARRKPELIDANTYNPEEFVRVTAEWNELLLNAEKIKLQLPKRHHDSYFQLVLHPVKAMANLHALYYYVALNKEAYKNRYAISSVYAKKAHDMFIRDSLITSEYHRVNRGKWNHMMSQTHIGYTYWQQPPVQKMPEVKYVPIDSNWQRFVDHDSLGNGLAYKESEIIKGPPIPHWHGKYYSVQASQFTRAINSNSISWHTISAIGRDGDGVTTFPVTAETKKPDSTSPRLEYEVFLDAPDTGEIKVYAYFSPTLNFHGTEKGLQYAVSINDEAPQIISINSEDKNSISGIWNKWVAENIIIKSSTHHIRETGDYVIKYWMISPGVVLQKIVLDFGGVKPSYLGPRETWAK